MPNADNSTIKRRIPRQNALKVSKQRLKTFYRRITHLDVLPSLSSQVNAQAMAERLANRLDFGALRGHRPIRKLVHGSGSGFGPRVTGLGWDHIPGVLWEGLKCIGTGEEQWLSNCRSTLYLVTYVANPGVIANPGRYYGNVHGTVRHCKCISSWITTITGNYKQTEKDEKCDVHAHF